MSESNNKDLNLPKKNNEMHEPKSNTKSIRLYSKDKINEIIQLLQAAPPTKILFYLKLMMLIVVQLILQILYV